MTCRLPPQLLAFLVLLIWTQPWPASASTNSSKGNTVVPAGELRLTLRNTGDGIVLISLMDTVTNTEWMADQPLPLWEVIMYDPQTKDRVFLHATQGWSRITVDDTSDEVHLRWDDPEDQRFAAVTVAAQLKTDPETSSFFWDLQVENSSAWSVYEVVFPQLALRELPNSRLFRPQLAGFDTPWSAFGKNYRYRSAYPGASRSNLQYFVHYVPFYSGIYFGLHDPYPTVKNLEARRLQAGVSVALQFDQPAENMVVAGNDFDLGGQGVWRLLRGDWFDAAMIYRNWVRTEASWYPELGPDGRSDTPEWFRKLPSWISIHDRGSVVDLRTNIANAKEYAEFMGVPTAVHWYGWYAQGHDNDYPHYFPPLAGDDFKKGIKELQNAGMYVMPYINMRLWDSRDSGTVDRWFSDLARPYAMQDPAVGVYLGANNFKEADGTPIRKAIMDPSTDFWQNTIRDLAEKLFDEYGVNGIYLDTLGAPAYAEPKYILPPGERGDGRVLNAGDYKPSTKRSPGDPSSLDLDPSHGHPLGGGTWYITGIREMLQKIREAIPPEGIITGEHTFEGYANLVDAGLSWSWVNGGTLMVPAYPAVYGGAVQTFGRDFTPKQLTGYPEAVRFYASEMLTFGTQIGWWDPSVVHDQKLALYIRNNLHLREQLAAYFYKGQMCRPPALNSVPEVTFEWPEAPNGRIQKGAVITGAWEQPNEQKLALIFANYTDKPYTVPLAIDLSEYGFAGDVQLQRIGPEGPEGLPFISPVHLEREVTFAEEEVWAWEITPASQGYVKIDSPRYGERVQADFPVTVSAHNLAVESVKVAVDGTLIYKGTSLPSPDEAVIKTLLLSEGRHQLTVTATGADGGSAAESTWFAVEKLTVVAPAEGANVSGNLPITLQTSDLAIQSIQVSAEGKLLYTGKHPDAVVVDTLKLPDGEHSISLKAVDAYGQETSRRIGVTVRNWTTLTDRLYPPIESGFFGSIDRALTNFTSNGWAYADPTPLFADADRMFRVADTQEELVWKASGLHDFSVTTIATESDIQNSVTLSISQDGSVWEDIDYVSTVLGENEDGWVQIRLSGEIPPSSPASFFRIVVSNYAPAQNLQLGEVSLRMRVGM